MAKDFSYQTTRPAAGWTSATLVTPKPSATGAVNALAQNNVTADALRTTPSTLADSSLGSRRFKNPNTGIRDVAASASVYNQADVPAFLSQAVSSLNAEQALQRSLQAEWNDKLLRGAMGQYSGSADPYVWMEALRAASVGPGSSVNFGQAIQDPNSGRAALVNAQTRSILDRQKAEVIHQALGASYNMSKVSPFSSNGSGIGPGSALTNPETARYALQDQARFLAPIATAAAGGGSYGGSSGWWSPRSTNSFTPGYL